MSLERGTGKDFVKSLERIVDFLKKEVETVFSGKDYENTKTIIMEQYTENTQKIIDALNAIGEKIRI